LVLQGGVEPVKKPATGRFILQLELLMFQQHLMKSCRSLVGSQFEGIIRKVKVNLVNTRLKETEIVKLDYRYEYVIDTDEEIIKIKSLKKSLSLKHY
jgi:hypothetical protein